MHLRRSALRLLLSPSNSFLSKPRLITTVAPPVLRTPRQTTQIAFQRRWVTGEAETTKENDSPSISELQPSPQEDVENAIHSDSAAEVAETAALQDSQAPSDEQNAVDSAIDAVKETAESATSTVTEAAQRHSDRIEEPKSTIYIGNLFFDVTENDLIKELSRFGPILKCRLIRDSRGLSKGFGYVDFETIEQATNAIDALNQQIFEGRRLAVQYAAKARDNRGGFYRDSPRPLNPPSKTLFIGNMSFEMTDRDLNNLFKGIRNVIDVRVAIDRRTGQPRGFAHADFVDVKSAMEAMKLLEGKETYGRKLRIDYSYGPSNAPRNQSSDDGPSSSG